MAARKPKKGHRQTDRLPRHLLKRERLPTIPTGSRAVYEPAGREKMSEVLEHFVAPYRAMAQTEDAYRKLLTLGILAWNAALLPVDKRPAMIDEVLQAGFSRALAEDRALAEKLVDELVRRKLEHFAANKRSIVSFELTDTGRGYQLLVASVQ